MMCSKLKMFNVQTLIVLTLVLSALVVQPTFGGNSEGSNSKGSGSSGSGSASVSDEKSTNSGQKGSCKLSGESKSGSGEDCQRQNETNCLVSCSRESGEAENCNLDEYDESESTTATLASSTTGAENSTVEESTSTDGLENSTVAGQCSCKLLDGLKNVTESDDLDDDEKEKVKKLKDDCHSVLVGNKCKNKGKGWCKWKEHRCKLKKVLKVIKKFEKENSKVWKKCEFKEIEGYGNFLQAKYAMKTVCAQDSSAEIRETETSNCTVCDRCEEYAEEQPEGAFKEDCKTMVFYLRVVFSYEEFDNSQRKGWAKGHIKRLCKKYPEKEQEIMDLEFGDSGDDVESFGEGCDIYEKVQGLPDILGGSVEDCPLLVAMREYYQNESSANGSLSERREMKQLCDKLSAFFERINSTKMRLSYCSAQFYQFLLQDPGMKPALLRLKITGRDGEEWGTCYDISFCSSFCSNFGCGKKTGGPGKFPSMSDRGRLITPDWENKTLFFTAFEDEINSWSFSDRLSVSSAKNGMISCIHSKNLQDCKNNPSDNRPGSKCRVKCVADVIKTITVKRLKDKLKVRKVKTYCGEKTCGDCCFATIIDFCGCP